MNVTATSNGATGGWRINYFGNAEARIFDLHKKQV
jgi:hypothetical protein